MKPLLVFVLSALLTCAEIPAQEPPRRGGGLMERFQQLDRDGDGKLTREEGRSLANFDAMDADRDGFLTPQEIATFDVAAGKATVLTDDGDSKDEVWGFFAPEYGGEVLYAAQVDNKEVRIYRDL
jgi:hypothetical protein